MPTIRRTEPVLVVALAVASLLAAWILPLRASSGLMGRYWDNTSWSGAPIAEAAGSMPATSDLLRHAPREAQAALSAEWTGFLPIDAAGIYRFELRSDDGAWLYLDDALVVDNGGVHGRQSRTGRISLSPGLHRVRVVYFQSGGALSLELRWTQPGRRAEPLNADALAPSEAAASRLWLVAAARRVAVVIPAVWACLFLYVPVRLAAWWAWREVERVTPRVEDRRALAAVLVLAFGLTIWGLEWGLAGDAWAPDELRPDIVREVLGMGFSGGWHDKYPLMHYVVLSIPVSAFQLADGFSILAADSLASHTAQLAFMRLVSVLMGLGTLVAAYLCGAEMYGVRRAALGALTLLLTPVFLFYGKTANLDVPSLCWFGWAVLAFLRIIRTNRRADYVLLGVTAAAAVATKDQAYANLALLPFAVVVAGARHQPSASWARRLGSAVVGSNVLTAAGAAILASVFFHNMVTNFSGFVSHVRLLSTLGDLAIVPRTAAGYAELGGTTVALFRLAFGWPLFVMAAAGVAGAVAHRERRWWLWLLLVPLSFHLTFTSVTLYACDRYLFGGMFVLALFAGATLSDLMERDSWKRAARAAVAGSLAYALLYAASINVMMNLDARNGVRAWVLNRVAGNAVVGMLGRYMPYLGPAVRVVNLSASVGDVRRARPGIIIVNARFARRFEAERSPAGRELLRSLEDGSLGYSEVFRYRAPVPAWALLKYEPAFRRPGESVLTNLDKVNPEMAVYEGVVSGAVSREPPGQPRPQ